MNIDDMIQLLGPDDPLIRQMMRETGAKSYRDVANDVKTYNTIANSTGFLSVPEVGRSVNCESSLPDIRADSKKESGILTTTRSLLGNRVGSYVISAKIGDGGFGQVFEAYDPGAAACKVAIKVFNDRHVNAIDRLEIEKFVLQKLSHPNLVAALEAGETDSGQPYLVMNLVRGRRIDQFIQDQKLDFRQIAGMFATIATALHYAHSQDVLHRDLKPSNVLIKENGEPTVIDFGLAKRLEPKLENSISISGELIGTLGYLSPEQASTERRELTRAVDIYGLGATLYHVLTGRAPVDRDNVLRSLEQLKFDHPKSPRSINANVPLPLEQICLKCLAREPGDRYESMEKLADDLKRYVEGKRIFARGVRWRTQLLRWIRYNPVATSLAAALAVSLVVGFVASYWSWWQVAMREQKVTQLLVTAKNILAYGDKSADDLLLQTPGSLKYRRERLEKSVAFFDELVEQFPEHDDLFRESATSWFRLGKVNIQLGNWNDGTKAFDIALGRFQELSLRYPVDDSLQFDVFHCYLGLDTALTNIGPEYGKMPVELQYSQQAFDIVERLIEQHPKNIDYRDAFACVAATLGSRYSFTDRTKGLQMLLRANEMAIALKSELPDPCQQWAHVGGSAARISEYYREIGDLVNALQWIELATNEIQAYLNRPDVDPGELSMWVGCLAQRIRLARLMRDDELADSLYEDCVEFVNECAKKYPDYHVFREYVDKLHEYEYQNFRN